MRLVNVFFFVLLAFVLFVLGNLYLTNHDLLIREVVIFGESIKIQSVILLAFLLGFLLNVLYTGIMELVRLVRGQWQRVQVGDREIPIMPTFHPAYVLRQYTQDVRRAVWEDLRAAKAWIDRPTTEA